LRTAALAACAVVALSGTPEPKPPPTLVVQPDVRAVMAAAFASRPVVSVRWAAPEVWLAVGACESGDWVDGVPRPGTHRWDYGVTFSHGDIYEGAFNFHPQTWDAYRDESMPDHAGEATPREQVIVAERVLSAQGWEAWPTCSRMLGLR